MDETEKIFLKDKEKLENPNLQISRIKKIKEMIEREQALKNSSLNIEVTEEQSKAALETGEKEIDELIKNN